MKKKDILPCLGRGFVAGTLLIQTINAAQDKKMGSLIGLALSTLIFLVMNYRVSKSCCSEKNCDVGDSTSKSKCC